MKPKARLFCGALFLLAVVAGLSASITLWLTTPEESVPRDFHRWIHEELGMSEAQEQRLLPSEQRYEENKRHFTEVIRIANRELAEAIAEDRGNSPRVQAAVDRIHHAMGQLQEATLEHIFEMEQVLEPAQYDRLIELTQEALKRQGTEK